MQSVNTPRWAFTTRLIEAGGDPSVGSVGDELDNALAETTVGSFKNELIWREGPWQRRRPRRDRDAHLGRLVQHRAAPRVPRRPHPSQG